MRGRYTSDFGGLRRAGRALHRARSAARPTTVESVLREASWRLRPSRETPTPPTWPVDQRVRDSVSLVWPDRYGWAPAASWLDPVRLGLEHTGVTVRRAETSQREDAVSFTFLREQRAFDVAIDYGDKTTVDPQVIDAHDLIFKMQYAPEGYGTDKVVPGGYVANAMSLYSYLPHLRRLSSAGHESVDIYGRFGGDKAESIRRKAIDMLTAQTRVSFRGGIGRVRYAYSLREAATAKTCLDLPGAGPLCFRFVDYLALGSCTVGPPHAARLHVPMEPDRHFVECSADLSDLVDTVAELAADEPRRRSIKQEARSFFDRFLHYEQLGGYYLKTCVDRLG